MDQSPVTLSLLVRLWQNPGSQTWQGEFREIAGDRAVRFSSLEQLAAALIRMTETIQPRQRLPNSLPAPPDLGQ